MKHTCSIWSTNSAIIKNVRIDVLKYTYKKKRKIRIHSLNLKNIKNNMAIRNNKALFLLPLIFAMTTHRPLGMRYILLTSTKPYMYLKHD